MRERKRESGYICRSHVIERKRSLSRAKVSLSRERKKARIRVNRCRSHVIERKHSLSVAKASLSRERKKAYILYRRSGSRDLCFVGLYGLYRVQVTPAHPVLNRIVAVMYILQASSWSVCNHMIENASYQLVLCCLHVIERKTAFYMKGLSFVTCVSSVFTVSIEFRLHQHILY